MKDETMRALVRAIANQTNTYEEQITPGVALTDLLDSLDLVEVVMALEEEFGIEIPDDKFNIDMSVDDLCEAVDRLRERQK